MKLSKLAKLKKKLKKAKKEFEDFEQEHSSILSELDMLADIAYDLEAQVSDLEKIERAKRVLKRSKR